MNTIIYPDKKISGICGEQTLKVDEKYRYSKYCISIPCKDGTLMYHTTTGELVLSSSASPEECDREWLIAHWFLVPREFDERKWVDQLRWIYNLLNTKS